MQTKTKCFNIAASLMLTFPVPLSVNGEYISEQLYFCKQWPFSSDSKEPILAAQGGG